MSVASCKQHSIALQLDKNQKLHVEENQRKILPVTETVFFCGQHHGHLFDGTNVEIQTFYLRAADMHQ